jgi:hypothetical protein
MRNGTEANNNVNNGQILQPTDEVWIGTLGSTKHTLCQ